MAGCPGRQLRLLIVPDVSTCTSSNGELYSVLQVELLMVFTAVPSLTNEWTVDAIVRLLYKRKGGLNSVTTHCARRPLSCRGLPSIWGGDPCFFPLMCYLCEWILLPSRWLRCSRHHRLTSAF